MRNNKIFSEVYCVILALGEDYFSRIPLKSDDRIKFNLYKNLTQTLLHFKQKWVII